MYMHIALQKYLLDQVLIILFRLLSPENRDGVGRIIMEVVDACVSVGRMVSPVVCNTSPEGFVLSEDDDASALLDKNTVSYSTISFKGRPVHVIMYPVRHY